MKNIITVALIFTSVTANATGRTCHEINGKGVTLTNLECYDLDKTTPGKYWYEKTVSKDGSVFAPDYTIMMRKKLEEERKSRKVQQKD